MNGSPSAASVSPLIMHSTATCSLATPVPGPAQFRGLPCTSVRYKLKPGVSEAAMFRAGGACVNPPAPGLVYCLLGRLESLDEYVELEVYQDYAALLHSFQRTKSLADIVDFMHGFTTDAVIWIGYLAHLPRQFQPVWKTVYEDLTVPKKTNTGRSLVYEVAGGSSCSASPSSTSSEEEHQKVDMFDTAFWTVSVPYNAELDTGGAVLLAVGMPHSYEAEPIRALVAEGCGAVSSSSSSSSEAGDADCDTTTGGMLVVPNEAAAVSKALELCAMMGFQGRSLASPGGDVAVPVAAAAPAPARGPRPRNVVVRFPSGPHRRCFADVAEQLGGRMPAPGDSVVVRLPGSGANPTAAAPLRLGTVVSVSAWCKRKSLKASVEPSVVERFATAEDAAEVERIRRRHDAVLFASVTSAAVAVGDRVEVVDAWCSLDTLSCTVVVAAPPTMMNRRSLSAELRRCLSGALMDAGMEMEVSVVVQA